MTKFDFCTFAARGTLAVVVFAPHILWGENGGQTNSLPAEAGNAVSSVSSGVAVNTEGDELAADTGQGLDAGMLGGDGDKTRPVTGQSCQVLVTTTDGGGGGEARETRVTFRNEGDEPVGEVLLVIKAPPLSYWGNSPAELAIFPDGKVDLFFAGEEGEPFLRPGQTKTIPVYHGGAGAFSVGQVACSSEDIFVALAGRVEIQERFGKYAPYAESSLRSLFFSEAGWSDILGGSGGRDSGGVGRRYFFSSVADSSLSAIAAGVGMMAAGGDSAPEDQRGYMAETSFGEARVAFEEGRLDDAVELLRRVLLLEPENAMVLNNMSYIMLKRGDDAGDVRPFIEQALKIDPSQPGFQNTMSILRWKEGNKEEAVRLAQQAYVGSGGEIVETRLNLLEWGGAVPTLSEKPDTQEEHQNVGEGWEDGPGEAIPRISGASEIIGADEASVDSGGAGEGEEKTVGTAGVSTSDTIPESGISE
jgi:hypothetical protein